MILALCESSSDVESMCQWYDPVTNRWQLRPEFSTLCLRVGLAVLNGCLVFAMGGVNVHNEFKSVHTVEILDLSLPTVPMLQRRIMLRDKFGVAALHSCTYICWKLFQKYVIML